MAVLKFVYPAIPKLFDPFFMQGCGSRSQFAPGILSEVIHCNLSQIDFCKRHRPSVFCWFGLRVDGIDEDTHPLFSRAMRINGAASFPGCLDLNPRRSRLDCVFWIQALNNAIRMTIKLLILNQYTRMFGETRGQHVRLQR